MQTLSAWIEKQDPTMCFFQEKYVKHRDTDRLKVEGLKNIHHAYNIQDCIHHNMQERDTAILYQKN